MDAEFLKRLPLFSGLSDDHLTWLMENGEYVSLQPRDILMQEGSPGDAFYIVLEGDFEIAKRSGNQDVVLNIIGQGEVLGEMSLLEGVPRSATVRALRDSRLLKISKDLFVDLLCGNPAAVMAILRTVTSRLRNTELMLHQSEKLASLGTLAAGLAHELNNPAAAAWRSADQLRQTVDDWLQARGALDQLHLEHELSELVVCRLRDDIARNAEHPFRPDPLTRSDRENEIQEWLESLGIDDAWDYAPGLVSFGWDAAELKKWSEQFKSDQLPVVIRWLATGYIVHGLLDEVTDSTERISTIVKAVKDYSNLDQAPLKEIDVHEGLESTLVMLKHKLKQGVQIHRDYAKDLPHIEAYVGELNQVWTNIVDNAVDAMKGQGDLTLRTYSKNGSVVIEIGDNGPGIPPDVQTRIFEPFFTTKGPGVGTGLGLHLSYNIVHKHRGKIEVQSKPGDTRFIVTLPTRMK